MMVVVTVRKSLEFQRKKSKEKHKTILDHFSKGHRSSLVAILHRVKVSRNGETECDN